VHVIKSLEDFDVESANGFDEEEGNSTPSEEELKETINNAVEMVTQEEATPQTLQ
jgi:SMC interacting uncharacterized protein involved in chromosome segregation